MSSSKKDWTHAPTGEENILKSTSYTKAYIDPVFMESPEARGIRILAEYEKPEVLLRRNRVLSTIIVYGSARTLPPDVAEKNLQEAKKNLASHPHSARLRKEVEAARIQVEMSGYYDKARKFAQIVSKRNQFYDYATSREREPKRRKEFRYVICTGGGPGIMEAANRGAHDVDGISIGLNITLPHEQKPNPYITPDLCFQFHYFAMRKLHFLLRAVAVVAFPGGFGTLDEIFTGLTLCQTGKSQRLPIILFGREYWEKCLNMEHLAKTGMISEEDLDILFYANTPEEAVEIITDFYGPTPK
ncbi:MAG: LOG family protein [Thermoguttaceae bacterium]|jgi:uncharacterized protein (TIGR00730 family)